MPADPTRIVQGWGERAARAAHSPHPSEVLAGKAARSTFAGSVRKRLGRHSDNGSQPSSDQGQGRRIGQRIARRGSAGLPAAPRLVRSKIAQRMFGTDEILFTAKQLCQIDGIDIARDLDEIEYVHFLLDRHEVVMSNGAETESLYTGAEALKSVGSAARNEIFSIFPELMDAPTDPTPARPFTTGRLDRKVAIRHAQNRVDLLS